MVARITNRRIKGRRGQLQRPRSRGLPLRAAGGSAARRTGAVPQAHERRCIQGFHLPGAGCPLVVLEDPPAIVGEQRHVDGHGNGSALPHLGVHGRRGPLRRVGRGGRRVAWRQVEASQEELRRLESPPPRPPSFVALPAMPEERRARRIVRRRIGWCSSS